MTYATGWLAAVVLALAIPARTLVRAVRGGRRPAWRRRLRWHCWLGAGAAVLGVGHGIASLTEEPLPLGPEIGLWLASAAAGLVVVEALVGATLRDPAQRDRPRARRYHVALVVPLIVLVVLHVVLNGPAPGL